MTTPIRSAVLAFAATAALHAQTAPAVPPVFQPFYQFLPRSDEQKKAIRDALPYERISLEVSRAFDGSGQLTLTLFRTGDATLSSDGPGGIVRIFAGAGDFVGTVNLLEFGKLSHLISDSGLERMPGRYEKDITDQQTVYVIVKTAARSISVADYAQSGPVELWAVQRAIEAVGSHITWKAKSK